MMIMMIRIRIKGQCTDLFHLIKIIDTMVGKSMQQSIGFVRPEEFLHSALPFFSRFRGDRHHDDVEDSYDGMLVTMSIMVVMMMLVMMMLVKMKNRKKMMMTMLTMMMITCCGFSSEERLRKSCQPMAPPRSSSPMETTARMSG